MTTAAGRAPNRWVVAVMGTLLQLCLGTVYAWSFFQSLLVKSYRWSYTDTAWAFSLVILTLGISAAWAGVNLPKIGPRKLAVAGGMLFSLSYLLGGLALHLGSIPLFYLGYSVVGGIGIGLGYVTPVSTVAKWFPDKRGLVTGVVVMGFGVGAFVMSKVLAPLLLVATKGDLVPVFVSLGVFFGVVLLPVTWLLQNPPARAGRGAPGARVTPAEPEPATRDYLFSGQFLIMWIVFFFNIAAGISVISFQSPLLQEIWGLSDPGVEPAVLASYGATLIAVSSLFNGLGRLLWGTISDRIGRVESFPADAREPDDRLRRADDRAEPVDLQRARLLHPALLRRRLRHHAVVRDGCVRREKDVGDVRRDADRVVGRRGCGPAARGVVEGQLSGPRRHLLLPHGRAVPGKRFRVLVPADQREVHARQARARRSRNTRRVPADAHRNNWPRNAFVNSPCAWYLASVAVWYTQVLSADRFAVNRSRTCARYGWFCHAPWLV